MNLPCHQGYSRGRAAPGGRGAVPGSVVGALEVREAVAPVAALELEAGKPVAAHRGAMAALAGAVGLGKQEEAAGGECGGSGHGSILAAGGSLAFGPRSRMRGRRLDTRSNAFA